MHRCNIIIATVGSVAAFGCQQHTRLHHCLSTTDNECPLLSLYSIAIGIHINVPPLPPCVFLGPRNGLMIFACVSVQPAPPCRPQKHRQRMVPLISKRHHNDAEHAEDSLEIRNFGFQFNFSSDDFDCRAAPASPSNIPTTCFRGSYVPAVSWPSLSRTADQNCVTHRM